MTGRTVTRLMAYGLAGLAGFAVGAALRRRSHPSGYEPNRHTELAQFGGTPARRYYTGSYLARAVAIADLRAMAHKRVPRLALE